MRIGSAVLVLVVLTAIPRMPIGAQESRAPCNGQKVMLIPVAGAYAAGDPRGVEEEHNRRCALETMITIANDSRLLLKGITLDKAQNDSSKKISKTFLAREKVYSTKFRDSLRLANPTSPQIDLRALYFARGMQAIRDSNFVSLRGILKPAQVARFDSNLVSVKLPPR